MTSRRKGRGLVHELDLYEKLTETVARFPQPVEYGIVEHHFAHAYPDDYRKLYQEWGHVAVDGPRKHSLSAYLSSLLGRLRRAGEIQHIPSNGTGRWSYNRRISAWAPLGVQGPVQHWDEFARAQGFDPDTWPAAGLL